MKRRYCHCIPRRTFSFSSLISVFGGEKSSSLTMCTDFIWDRVCFLLSGWYSALFRIQYENNIDEILMFSLLLSSAYPKSKTSQFLLLFQ